MIWQAVLIASAQNLIGVNKSTILYFNNTILLWCISSRELMSEAIVIKKIFNMSIFEFSPIVTSDMLQLRIIFNLSSLSEWHEDIKNFALVIQEENPSITREIINNH